MKRHGRGLPADSLGSSLSSVRSFVEQGPFRHQPIDRKAFSNLIRTIAQPGGAKFLRCRVQERPEGDASAGP